jgi:hypothetical protein
MLSRFQQFLFQPFDIAPLVFFRIMFGILGFADVIGSWIYYHLQKDAYNPEEFQFKYYGFEWVTPLSEPFMSAFFIGLCFLSLFIAIGLWYRASTVLFFLGFTYTYFLEKAHYLNHGYLFCWICFAMIFFPANKAFSLDVLRNPGIRQIKVPRWPVFLLAFLMGVVYFYGGIAKINQDWLIGMPLRLWLKNKSDIFLLGPLLAKDWMAYFMSYGGLLLDLFVAFFLLSKRTRLAAFLFVLFFHGMNLIIFSIGIFPALSISLTLLFFAPEFPRNIIDWLRPKLKLVEKIEAWWQKQLESWGSTAIGSDDYWQNALKWRPIITTTLAVVMLFHLLIPFRHHLFPGNVAWTEEGHRYSWRMMLRSKHGYGQFVVVKPDGSKERIKPGDMLGAKQKRKLFTHPDMILQFAHHLRDQYLEKGDTVEVYAEIKAKLNHRKYQEYIRNDVDLAKVEWEMFKSSDWIVPFEEENK